MNHHWRLSVFVLLMGLLPLERGAWAQDLGDAAAAKERLSAAERAKRDADKVYQWIRFHGEKGPNKPKADAPAATPAPAPAARAAAVNAPAKARPAAATETAVARAPALAATPAALQGPEPAAQAGPAPASQAMAPSAAMPAAAALAAAASPAPAEAALASKPAQAAQAAVEEEEVELRLIERVEPPYPRNGLRGSGEGSVLVRFLVRPDGTVAAVNAVKFSHANLVNGVLDAVSRWRFAPIAKAREATVEIGFRPE